MAFISAVNFFTEKKVHFVEFCVVTRHCLAVCSFYILSLRIHCTPFNIVFYFTFARLFL